MEALAADRRVADQHVVGVRESVAGDAIPRHADRVVHLEKHRQVAPLVFGDHVDTEQKVAKKTFTLVLGLKYLKLLNEVYYSYPLRRLKTFVNS